MFDTVLEVLEFQGVEGSDTGLQKVRCVYNIIRCVRRNCVGLFLISSFCDERVLPANKKPFTKSVFSDII